MKSMYSPFNEITRFEIAAARGTPICPAVKDHVRQLEIDLSRRLSPGEKIAHGMELFGLWHRRWLSDLIHENPDVNPGELRKALNHIVCMAHEVEELSRPPALLP